MMKIPWLDRVSNKEILKIIGQSVKVNKKEKKHIIKQEDLLINISERFYRGKGL